MRYFHQDLTLNGRRDESTAFGKQEIFSEHLRQDSNLKEEII